MLKFLSGISQDNLRTLYTHLFNGPFSGTTRVSQYQKGKTNLDFTEARDSEWHQLCHMQVCTLLQTDNHASNPPLSFLQAGCSSCRPTNSVKALNTISNDITILHVNLTREKLSIHCKMFCKFVVSRKLIVTLAL